MNESIAYLEGSLIPADECRLPVYNLGIVQGAAVTDFLRTFNGKPYLMEEHTKRLFQSCKYACIDPVAVKNVIRRSFASSKQIEFWIAFCCRSAFCQESAAGRSTRIFLVGISGVRY